MPKQVLRQSSRRKTAALDLPGAVAYIGTLETYITECLEQIRSQHVSAAARLRDEMAAASELLENTRARCTVSESALAASQN